MGIQFFKLIIHSLKKAKKNHNRYSKIKKINKLRNVLFIYFYNTFLNVTIRTRFRFYEII